MRIGSEWRDQVHETGHHGRDGDLSAIAGLGIRTLRFPFLWERGGGDWGWHDRRMRSLEALGIRPVAGLMHHGAGPLPGGLLDPGFCRGLARHARGVARRYPSIDLWTPVNEPLTTARFACLYGHWHPHLRDEGAFLRAVAAQCRAVLLAMQAIRREVPQARFMHTEDIGRVFATEPASEQAEYENERRWISLDLLFGRVDRFHPWHARLLAHGVPFALLRELAGGEAAPDLVGVNHYVTSDRFLDHRLDRYPPHLHGGNGRTDYADIEAVRAGLPCGTTGWLPRLREVWARYRKTIVISEAHLGCIDPLEQMRWLMEAWDAAVQLRTEGGDVAAVTAWALMGLTDWSSLLRLKRGHYEPGAFDNRHDPPRLTFLGEVVGALAAEGRFTHPARLRPGWWRAEQARNAAA